MTDSGTNPAMPHAPPYRLYGALLVLVLGIGAVALVTHL